MKKSLILGALCWINRWFIWYVVVLGDELKVIKRFKTTYQKIPLCPNNWNLNRSGIIGTINSSNTIDSIFYEGKNYDTLVFDPEDYNLEIVRSNQYFDFICLHKRINKPGDKCIGNLAECNNRGTCFEGKCYCLDGYINDHCICKTIF